MKVKSSVLLLTLFALCLWLVWIIEVNPFFNNTWEWTSEKRISFILAPILFFAWAYICRLFNKVWPNIITLLIFFVFFYIITFLITVAHSAGPSAVMFLFSPLRFLLYKHVSLLLISILSFGFNFIALKLNDFKFSGKEALILYFSFFSVPILMLLTSCIFRLIKANDWITGFFGFNNMDTILWFKSGIIIPVAFIYEGLIVLWKSNRIFKSKSKVE
ncbi:MAG: hypothetical protein J6Y69_05215 [Treponema sp.]|nr:hypothetical protein [Treponema sp.]